LPNEAVEHDHAQDRALYQAMAIQHRMNRTLGRDLDIGENRRIRRSRIVRAPQLVGSDFPFRM
jgi:hypothetical protein